MIVFYDSETLKITAIATARTTDNSKLSEIEKNDALIEDPTGPIVAEKIIDDDLIFKVWEAMDSIAEQCNVVLDDNKKISDIKIIAASTGEDR
jgi:hypothetical protein